MKWWEEVAARSVPGAVGQPEPSLVFWGLLVAAALVGLPPAWRLSRILVTLVHELGHALMGMAFGRKFTGFVVRADMAGHAVTRGPSTGLGIVATTWAGYPAPAIFAAAIAASSAMGWTAPVLAAILLVLLISLVRVRSMLTLLVMLIALGAVGSLWWWRNDGVQAAVFIGAAAFLVAGAWRQFVNVCRSVDPGSDPARLAALTRVPRGFWLGTFGLVVLAGAVVVAWYAAVAAGFAPTVTNWWLSVTS